MCALQFNANTFLLRTIRSIIQCLLHFEGAEIFGLEVESWKDTAAHDDRRELVSFQRLQMRIQIEVLSVQIREKNRHIKRE